MSYLGTWPWIYTSGRINKIAGLSVQALDRIDTRIASRAIELERGIVAWGQYLDDQRYTQGQWGVLGTSAAVQTIGLRAKLAGTVTDHHLIAAAQPILPADLTSLDPVLEAKLKRADGTQLRSIFRLAFIAEAQRLEADGLPVSARPPIVTHLLSASGPGDYWQTEAPVDGSSPTSGNGDVFMTAWVLHALRRFEDEPGVEFERYRIWLADQVKHSALFPGRIHYYCLAGLALQPTLVSPKEHRTIEEARRLCDREIDRWRERERRGVVVNRPIFEGFNLGDANDFTFLNPEVMGALYLLRRGNPKPTRRFVLQVVDEVRRTVPEQRAFVGQIGMEATVDQVWASRLLHAFWVIHEKPELRPSLRPPYTFTTKRVAAAVVLLAVGVGALITAISNSALSGFIAGTLVAVALFVAALRDQG